MLSSSLANVEPIVRTSILDLDQRFFPSGVHPGTLTEVIGQSGSGKTFLLTYLLGRFLTKYKDKCAILIDTRGHFDGSNLISVLRFMDPASKDNSSREQEQQSHNEVLLNYLHRLKVIKCFGCENFLDQFTPTIEPVTPVSQRLFKPPQITPKEPKAKRRCLTSFTTVVANPVADDNSCKNCFDGPPQLSPVTERRIPSPVEKELLLNLSISLLLVDTVDTFTHSPKFYASEHCRDATKFPNVLKLIKEVVDGTKTPVICTLSEYLMPRAMPSLSVAPTVKLLELARQFNPERTEQPTSFLQDIDDFHTIEETDSEESECSTNTADSTSPPCQNIVVEQKWFTQSISLTRIPRNRPPINICELMKRTSHGTANTQSETAPFIESERSTSFPDPQQEISISKKEFRAGVAASSVPRPNNFESVARFKSYMKGSVYGKDDLPSTRFTISSGMLYVIVPT